MLRIKGAKVKLDYYLVEDSKVERFPISLFMPLKMSINKAEGADQDNNIDHISVTSFKQC